uniref:Serine-threonine kinase receptor-associated protein n=1 Tax=Myxobolus squamalis TaxID=59785 RepID=A0A6B2G6C7_MYXSQ
MRTKLKGYKLSGFTRPITRIRYNIDGDLLFVSGKEHTIFSWRGSDFEPFCSYSGHKGAINDIYVQDDSKKLISASADSSLAIWDTETCKVLHRMNEKGSFILCGISLSCEMLFYIYMPDSTSYVLNVHELEGNHTLIYKKECKGVPTCAMWGFLDEHIIIGLENGELVIFDLNSKSLKVNNAHKSKISDIQMSPDYLHFITCSQDTTVLVGLILLSLSYGMLLHLTRYHMKLDLI